MDYKFEIKEVAPARVISIREKLIWNNISVDTSIRMIVMCLTFAGYLKIFLNSLDFFA